MSARDMKIIEPTARSTVIDGILVQLGQVWERKKDGKRVEIVWMMRAAGSSSIDRIQLRVAGAKNLKSTHWIDLWNLPLLYRQHGSKA